MCTPSKYGYKNILHTHIQGKVCVSIRKPKTFSSFRIEATTKAKKLFKTLEKTAFYRTGKFIAANLRVQ